MNRHYLPYLLLSFIITNPSKAQQTKTALLQGMKFMPAIILGCWMPLKTTTCCVQTLKQMARV